MHSSATRATTRSDATDLQASLASYMEMNEEADEASMAVEGNDAGAASGASNSLGGGGS